MLTGLLPKLAAALVTLWSNPDSVAVTVITTNGVPKIICAITIPRCVAANPTFAIKKKIAYCSSDRKKDGLFLGRPIFENLTSPALGAISKYGFNFGSSEDNYSRNLAKEFLIDVKRMHDESGLLSGGNQQKVALGKWLSIKPDVLLVNEPTRGVDVGAKSEIYQRMRELAARGITIIFASTDIQEITYLPDRVITFYRGMMIDEHRLEKIKTPLILKEITDPFNETNL